MSCNKCSRWLAGILAVAGLLLVGAARLMADDSDAKKTDAKKADAKSSDAKDPDAKGDKSAADEDQFKVPEGKPEDLLKFIKKISQPKSGQFKSQEDLLKYFKESRTAIVKASDKILDANPEGKIRVQAIEAKLEAFGILGQLGDADARKQSKELIEKLKDDKQPEVKKLAKFLEFRERLQDAARDPAAADKLWDDVLAELKTDPSKNLASIASMLASRKEYEDPTAAAKSMTELANILSKSKDPEISEMAKKLEGTVRRLTLLGKPIEIKGTMLDGKPFDQGSLKGKVVLVDFWATWCGPCRMELPNVKRNYEKYHDKGFEVVGVSLDRSRDDLEKFIDKEKITWPILFPQEEKDQFWNNPMAVYYGVNGIPCAILTNQKGEVVSLNARGPALTDKLEDLLGKADEKEAKADEKKGEVSKTPKN
jgi:thiol-disulfide isomerase/thioredoxin